MLIGAGAGVDDVFVGLESFVRADIPKLSVVLFDDRDDVFARLRSDRADDMPAPFLAHHRARHRHVAVGAAGGVAKNRRDREGETAFGAKVLDGEVRAVTAIASDRAISAGGGK